MDRRQYLALSGATLSTTVAGCSFLGDGTGDGTPTETLSPSERRIADFRSALESADYVVGDVGLDDGILSVEYESGSETESAVIDESEEVVLAFLEALEDDMDAEWLEAWLRDAEGEVRAVYTVHEIWVREWDGGERSDEEFFGRVEETISWQ